MNNYNKKLLLKHTFWGNFDTGALMIYTPLFIWNLTGKMMSVVFVFIIPIFIDIILDILFSYLSDYKNRKKLLIAGNFISGLLLCFLGLSSNSVVIFIIIILKSIASKLYTSCVDPIFRRSVSKEEYKNFLVKINLQTIYGASIGGQLLVIIYYFTNNFALIFFISGIIEIFSTYYLFRLHMRGIDKENTKKINIKMININFDILILFLYSIALAMFYYRMVITVYNIYKIDTKFMGIIFFIVFALSNMVVALINKYFSKYLLINRLIYIVILLVICFILLQFELNFILFVAIWFCIQLFCNLFSLIVSDEYNKKLNYQNGIESSIIRIASIIGTLIGSLIIGIIIDTYGFKYSFLLTIIFLIFIIPVLLYKNKFFQKDDYFYETKNN